MNHTNTARQCTAGLTLHADAEIRAQAMSVMKRILRGLPRLRNAMLLGMAGLAARIPDDTPEVILPMCLHEHQCCLWGTLCWILPATGLTDCLISRAARLHL